MSSKRLPATRSAGFSLAEALVALALAAILAAALTRFVTTSRWNAFKIREQLAIDVLSDSLVERIAAHQWRAGRTDGRNGTLAWRIDVAPIDFFVHARSIKPKKKNTDANGNQGGALGLTAISESTDDEPKDDQPKLDAKASPASAVPAINWIPYRVTTVVSAPSGRSHVVHTIRIGPQPAEKQSVEADQQ